MDDFILKSQKTLEFDRILAMLSDQAYSEGAKAEALSLRPLETEREINKSLDETSAAMRLMFKKGAPSFYGVADLSVLIARAERGGVLTMGELLTVAAFLRAARNVKDYRVRDNDREETCIDEYFTLLRPDREFEQSITDAILSEDEMADGASPELISIRRKTKAAEARVRDILAKIISGQNASKILQDPIVTQRAGRYVVPVKAECKHDMPGMVHDVSSSGQTVFIEPMAVVEANNEISVLKAEEKNEIDRILAEFSARVYERKDSLELTYQMLTSLDLIFAKAKLAVALDAFPPAINTEGCF